MRRKAEAKFGPKNLKDGDPSCKSMSRGYFFTRKKNFIFSVSEHAPYLVGEYGCQS